LFIGGVGEAGEEIKTKFSPREKIDSIAQIVTSKTKNCLKFLEIHQILLPKLSMLLVEVNVLKLEFDYKLL
jgi:hypothetical protein